MLGETDTSHDPSVLRPGSAPGFVMLGFVAGCALQLAQATLWPVPAYLACTAFPVLVLVLRPVLRIRVSHAPKWRRLLVVGAMVALGFGATGWRAQHYLQQSLDPRLEGRDLVLTGVVVAMPQMDALGVRMRLRVEQAQDGLQVVSVPPQLQLAWYRPQAQWGPSPAGADPAMQDAAPPRVVAGERWRLTVRLRAPHGQRNPHGFDYELWMWERGLQAAGYVRTGAAVAQPPQLLAAGWQYPVERARQTVRDRILEQGGGAPEAGWIAALVTGDQNAIDGSDWDVFRATGVAHLMSISGLHITMFAWLATALVGICWRRSGRLCLWWPAPHAAIAGGILLACGYALFSGWGVPAQRTVCMLLAVGALRLLGRQWPWPMVWLLACAVVVAWDPWALAQAGFWLSFVAVGVLFASAPAPQTTPRGLGLGARVRSLAREQVVVTAALAPLGILLFGQMSLVGLLANLVAIPWVTLVVTPLAMAGVVWAPLWGPAMAAVGLLGDLLQAMAKWSWVQWFLPAAPWWLGLAAVVGGALCVARLPWTLRLAALPLLLPVLLWQAPRPSEGQFTLLAADVGQGSAVLVRTAHHAVLYDAGPVYGPESDAGGRVLVPLLRAFGERLDVLVLSHRDTDHVGGAAAVLVAQPQARLLASLEPEHSLWTGRSGLRCEAGQRWQWDGVEFDVLHPPAAYYPGQDGQAVTRKPNDLSCVLRIRGRALVAGAEAPVALLVGDIEAGAERTLLASGQALRAQVLLVPHHGSKTSSTGEFLDAVAPTIAVVQAGYRNRFGHPAAEPMARYHARAVRVIESARCGAASWHSQHPDAVHCERQDAPRYWQHSPP
jgi:competence protein ComEC